MDETRAKQPIDSSNSEVQELRAGIRGDLVLPDDPRYDEGRAVWNGMIDKTPAVIVRAAGVGDVVAAVNFVREHDLPLSVRGGGHNVAGTAVRNDGVVIDLSEMTGIRVDREKRTVRAEGGATLGDVDRETQLFGLATPLGVVTSFEYALHDVGPEVYALFAWFRADDAASVLEAYREWTDGAPRDASTLAFTAHVPDLEEFPEDAWGDPALAFLGSYRGDLEDADDVFRPLLETATPIADLGGTTTFVDLQSMLDEDYPDGLRYYWKSIYLEKLTDEVLEFTVRSNEAAPSALSTIDLWHLGGAVAEVPRDATAFWHRDKPYMLTFEANWEDSADDDANVTWARDGIAEAQELAVASGRYGNFPGMNEDPAKLLYGDNYERLVDLKTRYDPENLFETSGSVAPRTESE
ncbi:FAD-binding oxidoreductase [Natronococcus wangiae]|uniref:FAD-binding oxidoreductase n=1 Tax=Natronococcus wangiae TaxID=3068275 RepID=UPI00273DF031|nr:FAD-binding oxidoreductase [Natronococcus sp. AD5]